MNQFTFKLDEIPEHLLKLNPQLQKEIGSGAANTPPNVEQDSGNAPVAEKEAPRFDSPVRVHLHSYRKRLCDIDGISGKAVLDGIVKAGILEDDSPLHVKEVSFSQEKVSKGEAERTVVVIEEV